MDTFPLELSPNVHHARYANFSRGSGQGEHIFIAGYEECAHNYRIERSDFPFWTLEFVVGGMGVYREGGLLKRLEHGSLFTNGPGMTQEFSNDPERPFSKYFLVRSGAPFPEAWSAVGLVPGKVLQLGSVASLITILDKIVDEGQQSDTHTTEIIDGLEQVLLALIARHRGSVRGEKSGARHVYETVVNMILEDYRNLESLSELAKRSGYSSEYLCRIFKRFHGQSPYQVLLHRKMSAAWLLLRNGHLQVSAVSRELGYEDPLHFSRVFRKTMGCAPSSVGAQ